MVLYYCKQQNLSWTTLNSVAWYTFCISFCNWGYSFKQKSRQHFVDIESRDLVELGSLVRTVVQSVKLSRRLVLMQICLPDHFWNANIAQVQNIKYVPVKTLAKTKIIYQRKQKTLYSG